jgi:hypothetical protein
METTPNQNPCAAEAMLGTEQQIRYGKKRRVVKGTIIDWRYGTATIEKMCAPEDGSRPMAYPSFELKIKPNDGGKAIWIGPFKDSNNPYPSDMWLGDVETMNRRDPGQLMCRIRATIFGHCAGEQITYEYNDDAWNAAAFCALDDVCDLVDKHFPDATQEDIGLAIRY